MTLRYLRVCWLLMLAIWTSAYAETSLPSHPLLPGVYSREVQSAAWPRTLHDNLATGFSPLVCGMSAAPVVWSEIDLGGLAEWTYVLRHPAHEDRLLVSDGRLRLVSAAGDTLWNVSPQGYPVFYGNLSGIDSSPQHLLLSSGPRLSLLDAHSGETLWSHTFDPPHVQVQAAVDDILPELPGLEVAVVLAHGEDGSVINFPPLGEPTFVWQRKIVVPGEYDERYDHHCGLKLDVSVPGQPVIWNVRRYRCRGFDARNGQRLSTLEYDIGGERRRNYGPWDLGHSKDGDPLVVVAAESVQVHVHGIRLHRNRDNELAWQHYYGEVYKEAFGVALEKLTISDLDRDGGTEIAYSVRDPAQDFRSYVRVRDAATGDVEWELADYWGVTAFEDCGADRANGLIVCADPNGTMPKQGTLEIYRFDGTDQPRRVAKLPRTALAGPMMLEVNGRRLLLVCIQDLQGLRRLALYDFQNDRVESHSISGPMEDSDANVAAVLRASDDAIDADLFIMPDSQGQLVARTWSGEKRWQIDVNGGSTASLSAADLDHDGRAELVAITPSNRVRVLSFSADGSETARAEYDHTARWGSQSPLLHDLDGSGEFCLVAPAKADDGRLMVCAYRQNGAMLWSQTIDGAADNLVAFVAHAGQFLPHDRAAVAVSIRDNRLTREGTYLLDGPTGEILWFKGLYRDGLTCMPYRAHGIPTAFDIDADGVQEVGMDMLSYMAFLNGEDGSFAYVRHSPNIRSEEAIYAGHLYNTFCPVYRDPADPAPYWFVKAGFGPFGVMNPDVVTGIWRVDHDYDVPPAIGMVDVDADGELEVGYAPIYSETFVCRNFWTGDIEWELKLPHAPNSPCLTADVDGDAKGEFLIGPFCIGTDDGKQGKLRWQSPVSLGWAAIADFDGDGQGEIACASQGKVVVLNAAAE